MFDFNYFQNLEAEKYWSPPKSTNLQELAKNLIFSGDYIGARKIDGHWAMLIKHNGVISMRGRDESVRGGYLNKIGHIPHIAEEFNKFPNGTVAIGEIYFPYEEGSKNVTTILGCKEDKALIRQKNKKLHYYIFDMLAYKGESLIEKPLEERIKYFRSGATYIHFAEYFEGQALWNLLVKTLEDKHEGVVIQRRDGQYEPGKRTTRKTLKIKKEIQLTIDAYLTGNYKKATETYKGTEPEHWQYWINNRTNEKLLGEQYYDLYFNGEPIEPITKDHYYDLPASIEFAVMDPDGQDQHLCWISNITDEIKYLIKEDTNSCRGKVAKISAMEIDSETGKLRHAKIMEWRIDKPMKDCTSQQLK